MKWRVIKKILKIIIVILLLTFYGFLLTKPINLTTADLGRHIKNGEIVLQEAVGTLQPNSVLNSNFYSQTHPEFPFINHHWLSGVIFFIVQKITGWSGLSIFYILLSLLAFLIFFILAKNQGNFETATLASIILIPLIAQRKEIRPEVFGYLLGAIFLALLVAYQKNKVSKSRLLILPFLTLLWVNLHISFFIGLFLIAIFWFEALIKKNRPEGDIRQCRSKLKWLTLILTTSIIASFLNPNTWRQVIYPINIFKNYGYRIVENQSIIFFEKYGLGEPNLLHFEITFAILALSFIILIIKNYVGTIWANSPSHFSGLIKKIKLTNILLTIAFSLMAWFALRNLTLFGFFMLPVLASNIKAITPQKLQADTLKLNSFFIVFALIIIIFIDLNSHDYLVRRWQTSRIGLTPGINNSAQFFKDQNLRGPIFNNYDIGSYLIYHLYPKEKVFVDNRPETYPVSFFEKVYIPMQERDIIWQKQNFVYSFNVIFFSYHDITPWAQEFLTTRLNDPAWAPVFADNYVIIFLKRNEQNRQVIEKFEIPKENFSIRKN